MTKSILEIECAIRFLETKINEARYRWNDLKLKKGHEISLDELYEDPVFQHYYSLDASLVQKKNDLQEILEKALNKKFHLTD